jgi:glutamyl-tRNA reductase
MGRLECEKLDKCGKATLTSKPNVLISIEVAHQSLYLVDFANLTLCGWQTASLRREGLAQVTLDSEAHGLETVRVESCQRIEVYRNEGCDCDASLHIEGIDALVHLAEVAAGLHSVVLGEEQVLGQVRAAIAKAPADMQRMAAPAIAAARALRAETTFGVHTGHLLDRALQMAEIETPGDVGVIGVGSVGRLVAERAKALGARRITLFGRRQPEGEWFTRGDFEFAPLHGLKEAGPFDVLVSCLGSAAAELDATKDLPDARKLIVDLGTPRNVGGESGTRIITIAEMHADERGRRHRQERRTALSRRLRELLDERLAMAAEDSATPIGRLRLEVERVRRAEVERTWRLHPELAPETVDQITRSLVNQIFHLPSKRLRELDDGKLGAQLAALFAQPEAPEEELTR